MLLKKKVVNMSLSMSHHGRESLRLAGEKVNSRFEENDADIFILINIKWNREEFSLI